MQDSVVIGLLYDVLSLRLHSAKLVSTIYRLGPMH